MRVVVEVGKLATSNGRRLASISIKIRYDEWFYILHIPFLSQTEYNDQAIKGESIGRGLLLFNILLL